MSKTPSWNYFQQHCLQMPELGMSIDTSRMNAPDNPTDSMQEKFSIAFEKMQELEKTLIEGWNNELGRISLISQPGYGTLIMLITGEQDSVNDEAGVKILKNIRQKVNSLDCSLTYERIPAEWKRLFNVWDTDYVDSMKQMDSLKKVYDPNDTLNSGRFIFN